MQQVAEGTIQRNKRTGEVRVFQGGQWVSQGGAAPSTPVPMGLPAEIVGPPKEASPQLPIQQENTQGEIEQRRRAAIQSMRQEFQKQQPYQDFQTVLPILGSAMKAGPNKAGDLDIVYAFGKAMDPNSVVREGEQVMAQGVGGVAERVKGYLQAIDGQGQLTDAQRLELVQEIRRRAHAINLGYNQQRDYYSELAHKNGFDPAEVVGPHLARPYQQAEGDWFRRVAPEQMAPEQIIPQGQGEFGPQRPEGYLPPGADKIPEQLRGALASGEIPPDPYAIMGWAQQHGGYTIPLEDAKAAAEAMKKGVIPGVAPVTPYKPDISDVRGGENTPTQDTFNAGVRGLADTVTLGTADKLIAGADTLFKGGSMDQNLARQYAISDYDSQNHPVVRGIGQVAGGALLPMGEVGSVGNLALKGAGYGAAYGAGSSRSLSDVPMNALLGAGAGAAVPAILGGTGRAVNALRGARTQNGIPPLVDSATGELNQPLDAMTSAQRLDAVRGAGIENPTPGMVGGRSARVLEQGFNNLPGSAGLMEDVNSAASGQLRRGMQNVAQKFGSSKTLNEGGAELQRGASERIERGKGVIEKAYSAIPIPDTAPASKTNTIATLQELTGRFQSNPDLAASLKDPKLAGYLDALQRGDISWRDLKDFRSIIGEKIGEMRFGESSSTSDLRALYAGLSEDMRNTAASLGPKATRAFERANNLNRQNEQLIQGALTRILGKDGNLTPEKAAAAVQAMTRGGKASGDLKTLAQIKNATVKSGAWDEIASTLIHLGGQPAGSEGRAFQPDTFVRWYADMAEPARKMLFKPELRGELDKFVAVNQQLSRLKGLSNSSNTTPTMIGSGVIGASGMIAVTNPMALLVPLGGGIANNLMARLWTSPKFVNLMTGYSKAAATGNQNAVRSQIGRLQKLATTNPELREGIEHLLRSVANDNAPAAGQAAASPDEGPQQQGQPQ